MRLMILAAALACLATSAPANAQGRYLRVYPVLQQSRLDYVIHTDNRDKIDRCQATDPTAPAAATEAACAKIVAKGIPADVTPAVSTSEPGMWITTNDYPPGAIIDHATGDVEVLFEVDAQGAVASCLVYKTSGRADFDKLACAIMRVRARFRPARYKGQPTYAAGTMAFHFAR